MMYCTIIYTKDGIPTLTKVEGNSEYVYINVKESKICIPVKDLQKVLDFFK